MSAPHDTPEAVEAMAARCTSWYAAVGAMLRRLHARAVEAEAQASRAISAAENWHHEARRMREALATAHADALREIADMIEQRTLDQFNRPHPVASACADAILALIEKKNNNA